MSLKVLCFGDTDFVEKAVQKLRTNSRQLDPQEQIVVDNIQIANKPFLVFSIRNSELIASQATGTNAIIYFLDISVPIYEQKQFLFSVLDERQQFQNLPLIITFSKDQYIQIKQIVNSFELFKIKDRASMIKEIDFNDQNTLNELFVWIDQQNQSQKANNIGISSGKFDAMPKIVKMKPKYRESQPESTEKKYENIVKDKAFKNMNVQNQEQAYINNEKEKIKNQNMQKQLANFNKNKKKMSPYDIKATPNPKIEANLHFFLKDPKIQKSQEVNIKIQTDQFKQLPKPKPYVSKKTGINVATQIQSTELFEFDKQVQPILEILTTRALEEATLEIQEHEQCLKINKYKNAYNQRVKKQKKHESDNINAEMEAIKDKQRILQMARKKDQNKKMVAKKQTYYSISNKFLEGMYQSAAVSLYKKNFYPDQLQHHLKTDYLPEVFSLALKSYDKILQKEDSLKNVFSLECIKPIIEKSKIPRVAHQALKKQKQKRFLNKGPDLRYIHILYEHSTDKKFSSFTKYLEKQLNGTLEEFLKSREDQIQQIQDKLQSGEVDEAQVTSIKQKDNKTFSEEHKQFLLPAESVICHAVTQNRFQKPNKANSVVAGVYCFNNEGALIHNIESITSSDLKCIKSVNNLRYYRNQINMDDGLIVNLEDIPENISSLVFYTKINDVNSFAGENQSKTIKNAVYGLQFYEKNIPIISQNFGQKVKWEEFAKPQEEEGDQNKKNEQKNESLVIFSYHLKKKNKELWKFQEIKLTSKNINEKQFGEFTDKIANFFKQSLDIFKVEEQEQKPVAKTPSRGSKRKSRKAIEEKQKQKAPQKLDVGITSRVLKETEVKLNESWTNIFNKLGDEVIDWKQFIENSPDGWYLEFRGKRLEDVSQVCKFSKVGDIILRKVQPVIEEVKPQIPEEGEENAEEQP